MTYRRNVGAISAISVAVSLSACASVDINERCNYSSSQSFGQRGPDSFALLIGVPPGRAKEVPLVVLYSPSQDNPQRLLTLSARPHSERIPIDLDESQCRNVDWKTYSLSAETDDWSLFWGQAKARPFEIGIGFLKEYSPLFMNQFGVALTDAETGEYVVSCGCFWQ